MIPRPSSGWWPSFGFALAVLSGCADSTAPSRLPHGLQAVTLSAGWYRTCAVDSAGRGYCWGITSGNEPALDSVCSGGITCSISPEPVLPGDSLIDLQVPNGLFGQSACALRYDGTPLCWGYLLVNNDFGASLGADPTPLSGTVPLQSLALGATHICGLARDGAGRCWGDNNYNPRGTGLPMGHTWDLNPNVVVGGLDFVSLAAGFAHTCGLTVQGDAWCWGLGPAIGNRLAPREQGFQACGLTPLPFVDSTCVLAPVEVSGGRKFAGLAAGTFHTCAVTADEFAYCWGYGFEGRLGNGGIASSVDPVQVAFGGTFASITAGTAHTCALRSSGTAYCWGSNAAGQLGIGSIGGWVDRPTQVNDTLRFRVLAAGEDHTCGITLGGQVYCWGGNDFGQLGDGTGAPSPVPVAVRRPAD